MRYEVEGRKIIRFGKEFLHMPVKFYNELRRFFEYVRTYWLDDGYIKQKFPILYSFFKEDTTKISEASE